MHSLDDARRFLEARTPTERVVIYADFDGDGLAAAAVLTRGLRSRGIEPMLHIKQRHQPPWSAEARATVAALKPDALVLTDLGVQDPGFLPEVPTLYLDHHIPSGMPGAPHVICVPHDAEPTPCSAWLAYEVVRPWLPSDDPALWVAGVGVLSDLGDKAPWPRMGELRERFRITHVRKAVTLCNASRRAAVPLSAVPLEVLLTADEPKAMTQGEAGELLEAARQEVQAELGKARQQRPIFATEGLWVHIPVHSPCQVHPLIAQQWAQRLPKYIAISTNPSYLPDAVAFSIRTKVRTDVPAILRALPFAPDHRATFGHGHDRASGGQLPAPVMQELFSALHLPLES